jgi:hypothetical protein
MAPNVGNLDRALRLILGIALIVAPFVLDMPLLQTPIAQYGAPIVGAVLAFTAAIRFCPLYRLVGLRTCPIDPGNA